MIDSHVHCRDWFQDQKETISHALKVAQISGIDAIFDMPNCDPPITTKDLARLRLWEARKANSNLFYGIYMGVSSNPSQLNSALRTYSELFPKENDNSGIIGLKMFAGKSVGDLTVSELSGQHMVYSLLRTQEYPGVLAVHCEEELLLREDLWDQKTPITHCYARPLESELKSIEQQINLAKLCRFAKKGEKGKLHIVHVTSPESVDLIDEARNYLNISCAVTPHHLLFNESHMNEQNGLGYKVNPPLRSEKTRQGLVGRLKQGKIDLLESDHAPHTYSDKFSEPYMSGIPGLASWPSYIKAIEALGIPSEKVRKMMHENVNALFKINIRTLEERGMKRIGIDSLNKDGTVNLTDSYAFNPIEGYAKNGRS